MAKRPLTSGTDAAPNPNPNPNRQLGAGIRMRRKQSGLTLTELAKLTELSQPFLSQVERGVAQPSMRSLNRIATALRTNGPALLAGPPRPGGTTALSRHDDGGSTVTNDEGAAHLAIPIGSARSLSEGLGHLTVTEFVDGMEEWPEPYVHDGEEALYVVCGSVDIQLDDQPAPRLGPRDCIAYSGFTAHRWRMLEPGTTVLLISSSERSVTPT